MRFAVRVVIGLCAGLVPGLTRAQDAPGVPVTQAPSEARDDETATEVLPPTGTESSAATGAAADSAASGAETISGEDDTAAIDAAREHFRQGVAFAAAGNCGGAIVEFRAAYEIVPRPNALYNIAQCQERLFRYDLAIAAYEEYLRVAPADAPDRAAVTAALGTLRNLLGVVGVASNVPAEVWIDDRLAGAAPGDVFVPAGGHALELRAKGYIPERKEVRLVGRARVEISFTLEKAQTTVQVTETTGLHPVVFWVGVGATAVAAGVGTVFALRVKSLHDDAEAIPAVSPERESARDDIEQAELLADVFFGTGLVLAVGTTVVGFLTEWDPPEARGDTVSARSSRLRVTPAFGRGAAGVAVGGAFP